MTDEIPLAGGDINVVVRVGDTVRRPPGPSGVRALLQWYEHVGFDGAPRFLGLDDQGREMLSFVEGEPAFAPVPPGDDVVVEIGRLLRRAHDAQAGFVPPDDPGWHRHPADGEDGEVTVRIDRHAAEWGLPPDRRGERLRLLCDGYGLTAGQRAVLLDELIAHRRARLEQQAWRGVTPREVIVENLRWVEDHYGELATFLA